MALALVVVVFVGCDDSSEFADGIALGCSKAEVDGSAWGYAHGLDCALFDADGAEEATSITPGGDFLSAGFDDGYEDCFSSSYASAYVVGVDEAECTR